MTFPPLTRASRHFKIDTVCTTSDELTSDDSDLLHAALGHASMTRIRLARNSGGYGLDLSKYRHDPTKCEACLLNRRQQSVAKTSQSGKVYTYFGECICSDACGP